MKTPSSGGRPPGGRGPASHNGQDRPRGRHGEAHKPGGKAWGDKPRHDAAPPRSQSAPPGPRQPRLNAPAGAAPSGVAARAAPSGVAARAAPYLPKPSPRPTRSEAPHSQTLRPPTSYSESGRSESGRSESRLASAPPGTIWLYGLHPIAAALANPSRRLRRLLVTEEAEAALAGMVTTGFSVAPERTERARLDQLLGRDAVHQGAALLADPLAQPALSAVLERPGPVLVLDQVTDPRNVGAILRSAAAFGAACVIAQDRHAPDETGALAKAASGALEIMPLIRAVNLARTLVALKAAGLWTVGLAAEGAALRGEALRERRVALVLGAEGTGLRRLTRETCDELAGLAMPGGIAGGMESLNVSAAATVALYELTRG